jgi:hypothetical protein
MPGVYLCTVLAETPVIDSGQQTFLPSATSRPVPKRTLFFIQWVQEFILRAKSGWSAKLTVHPRLEQELVIPGATDVYPRSLYLRVLMHHVIKSTVTVGIAAAVEGRERSASRCRRFITEGKTHGS